MKKRLFTWLSMGTIVIISACGQNDADQKFLQQAREDSIKVAVEQETRANIANQRALEDSIRVAHSKLGEFNFILSQTRADLETAKDKMNSIKEFQLGRTPAEREQQIRNQSLYIQSIEDKIVNIENSKMKIEAKIADLSEEIKTYK